MMENSKHVRVDNWGVFFLQRLQMFFNKTDYCDLTLQFDGNVQLKVHRLVMNACTEYFQVLEQTCDVVDDNIILMPPDLQADIILPIVNFMYTGTLEYHPSIYERLVQTADLMNIPILIKLLEAHKAAPIMPQKRSTIPPKPPKKLLNHSTPYTKRTASKPLPSVLPGRKLPVWKRKTAPGSRTTIVPRDRPVTVPSVDNMGSGGSSGVGALISSYKSQADVSVYVDNTPRPTRFEWPDGDNEKMKTETYMESSAFDNLTSYSSLPLIRGEDTDKIPVYEELRYGPTVSPPPQTVRKRTPGQSPYTSRRANQPTIVHRSFDEDGEEDEDEDELLDEDGGDYTVALPNDDDVDADDPDYRPDFVSYRKRASAGVGGVGSKRVRFTEKENKGREKGGGSAEIDHNMLIAELLKKYPNLAKTNKNIKLKIMTRSAAATGGDKATNVAAARQHTVRQMATSAKITHVRKGNVAVKKSRGQTTVNLAKKQQQKQSARKSDNDGPWICDKCENPPDPYHLYYLYRKHMTDVHQEQFSPLMCKYCGKRTGSERALSFHMHTVHGASLSNVLGVPFPQCNRCPFAALTDHRLARHRVTHNRGHVQCPQCKVGFSGAHALNMHQQITNHISPDCDAPSAAGMTSYDCQYCTRHWQNSATLFVHLRTAHREDARKDGIVSIDEDPEEEEDEVEEEEEEEEEQEIEIEEMVQQDGELVEEQQLSGSSMSEKVKILTDVKVSNVENDNSVQMQMENSGITTTLGLVDIVVLDENQQYILQSTNGDLDQSEFILPQITGSFVHQGQQVITTSTGEVHQVITTSAQQNVVTSQINERSIKTTTDDQLKNGQSIVSAKSGVSTTDELVMVLTDHDYNDDNADDSGQIVQDGHVQANGNIVVLYSHPVQASGSVGDNQMTCENGASLLVQTAEGQVLEIRNGPPDVVDHASHQESIEMIEQELNNTQHIVLQRDEEHDVQEQRNGDAKGVEEANAEDREEEQQVMLVMAEEGEEEEENEEEEDAQQNESIDAQDGGGYKDKDEHDACGAEREAEEPMDVDESTENQQIQNPATERDESYIDAALPHGADDACAELASVREDVDDEPAKEKGDSDAEGSSIAACAMEVDCGAVVVVEGELGDGTGGCSVDELDVGGEREKSIAGDEDEKDSAIAVEESDGTIRECEVKDTHEEHKEDNSEIEPTPTETHIPNTPVDTNNSAEAANTTSVAVVFHNNDEETAEISNTKELSINNDASSEQSKTTPQTSTIALLDEWEDTEDSSSQDKNCQATAAVNAPTDTVNKLINDDWDDDD